MVKKSSFKYFIGYNDDDYIRPLCIKLPQMIKHFVSNKIIVLRLMIIDCYKSILKYGEKLVA